MSPSPARRHYVIWGALSAMWFVAAALSVWAWMLSDDLGYSTLGLFCLLVGVCWCAIVARLLAPTKGTNGSALWAILLGIAHLAFALLLGWPDYPPPYNLPMRMFWGPIAFALSLAMCGVAIGGGIAALRKGT